jgi:hypothetical protein
MNITQIVPAELSGFCDVATGECVVADATPEVGADSPPGEGSAPAAGAGRGGAPRAEGHR